MDNQNKIGMFLVAIVAIVAVVGIVLQFSGPSSADLDFSATGEAVYTKEATSKLSKSSIVNEMKNSATKSNAGRIDTDSESEATAAGSAYGTERDANQLHDFSIFEHDSDHYMRQQYEDGCNSCSMGCLDSYESCIESANDQVVHCLGNLDPSSQYYESEAVDCVVGHSTEEANCASQYALEASNCEQTWTSSRYEYHCQVPPLMQALS